GVPFIGYVVLSASHEIGQLDGGVNVFPVQAQQYVRSVVAEELIVVISFGGELNRRDLPIGADHVPLEVFILGTGLAGGDRWLGPGEVRRNSGTGAQKLARKSVPVDDTGGQR